jgi:hypothetical protein
MTCWAYWEGTLYHLWYNYDILFGSFLLVVLTTDFELGRPRVCFAIPTTLPEPQNFPREPQ